MSYRKHLMTRDEPPSELYKATEVGTNLAQVGTDCISRQAAIDALRKMQTYKMFSGDDMLLIDQAGAMTELMLLPPAEPKRGKWIEIINSRGVVVALRCSRCEKSPRHGVRSDFCPNCGAKMEGTT